MTRGSVKGLVLLMLVAGLGACATTAPSEPSLYKRLGGREGIALVVDDFVANVVADDRINARFKSLPPPAVFRLKSNLADQICEAAGGPCSYVGRDMKTAHRGMNVTEIEWNATVQALVKALDKHRVAERDKRELLGLLGSMKQSIVGQ
ncbi:MAG TPA: group 1 truncated hemoglobin [Methylomirabilota bacterium]|jgi:hemoglobin|nr:group 1 truncated hemoglobin [Methylomirabilota bacterium]